MEHEIFETNPQLEKVFVTTDGEAFYNDNDAKNHAKNLDDKGVKIIFNTDFLEVVVEKNVSEDDKALAEFEADEKAKAEKLAEDEAQAEKEADEKAKAEKLAEDEAQAEKEADEKAKAEKLAEDQAQSDKSKAEKKEIKPNTKK